MESRSRIVAILKILYQYSDDEHCINATFIAEKLRNEYNIEHCERKTIYSDLKALIELGFPIEYNESYFNNGYSLYGEPFNLAEIKILKDMVNSFKPLDKTSTAKINAKLDNFTTLKNQQFLKHIENETKKKDNYFIYHLEMILKAIRNHETLKIVAKSRESEIIPYFLNYANNNYYLYYQYLDQTTADIYHIRLDRIKKVIATNVKHEHPDQINACKKYIEESYDAFKGKETVEIVLDVKKDYIFEDLQANFEKVTVKGQYVYLKTSVSDNLFGKLCAYGTDVKIIRPESFKQAYLEHLKKTINQYD